MGQIEDSASPRFCPKPKELRQPAPKKHQRSVFYKKPQKLVQNAVTSDWPCFLGPSHDGISPETRILDHFDQPQPGKPYLLPVWSVEKGESYSAPSVKDSLIILFHRLANNEVVECLDAETGEFHWSYEYPTTYRDRFNYLNGPRAAPTIDKDRVYTCGVQGMLHCFDLKTGHLYWQRNLAREFELDEGFFGITPSPLVEEDMLILNLGGKRGASVAGFDKYKGTLKWLSDNQWDRSYATPVTAMMYGKRVLFVFAGGMSDPPTGGLLGLDPLSGKIHFSFPWRSPRYFSVNASSPVISGNRVFISSSYDVYGAMIEVQPDLTHKLVYATRNYASHWMTPILRDGYLYGFVNSILVCMEWDTGKLIWKKRLKLGDKNGDEDPDNEILHQEFRSGADQYRDPPGSKGFGFGSLIWVDGHFLCLGETGLLACLELSPKGCRIISSCRLFSASQTWTAPVLSRGLLYVNQNLPGLDTPPRLLCYSLRVFEDKP
ncbi:MAG: PQQ-like beta-propeller repeat protein [Kiritimatiellae bacterium]|nr:PQQ-like beta-propeller repeat protein [Kiritimatiellia bacterium]MDD5521590.1 PQQ-like beta-propeller repeat protein [Kiritimatiellia bacterium]